VKRRSAIIPLLPEAMMSRILIVEDEQHQRELYAMELQDDGYEVDQAANGKEAVEKVKNNKYDLVVLDIRMPEMDGIEALGKILSRDKKIPIIIYTAYSNYKSNFMTWTADAYITKSSNLDELKNKIKEILSSRSR
jgi:two-component system, response regulator, stage 0 sporulation protein F